MAKDIANWLRMYAQQFEDQHAPDNLTIGMREAAKELDRLQAGGCARDQSTTQYCAEAARLAKEIERLRAALQAWDDAVRVDVLMEGPRYMGVDLRRGRDAWEKTKAILQEPRT
jgi:phage host-nuclease inhibitor protein Gam